MKLKDISMKDNFCRISLQILSSLVRIFFFFPRSKSVAENNSGIIITMLQRATSFQINFAYNLKVDPFSISHGGS